MALVRGISIDDIEIFGGVKYVLGWVCIEIVDATEVTAIETASTTSVT